MKGKYAVVTGAAQGIGCAVAKRFLQDGAAGVALLDWNAEAVQKAAQELSELGLGRALAFQCDVSDYEGVGGVMRQVEEAFGQIDILVNNAAITRDAIFHKMTPEQWHAVVNVNLHGPFNCTRHVIQGMRDRGYGRIICISSTSAFGNPGQANYASTKAAMFGFVKTLAKEGARKGITANAVLPDFIKTEMMCAIPEELMKKRLGEVPMQRMGTVEELAATCAFLASSDASYVTGACIECTGAIHT